MAFVTGTATDPTDLFSKLVLFLTTDANLVSSSQNWSVVWDTPIPSQNQTDIVLKGPGQSNQDQVFVGLRLHQSPTIGDYAIHSCAMAGFRETGESFTDHVNVVPKVMRMFLENSQMTYWFVASGRRFIVIVKISTRYEAMYAGLFLPFATPVSYPYPMFIGGSASAVGTDGGAINWQSDTDDHRFFHSPSGLDGVFFLDPAGAWQNPKNRVNENNGPVFEMLPEGGISYHIFRGGAANEEGNFNLAYKMFKELSGKIVRAFGGNQMLIPVNIINRVTRTNYGQLDGCYFVSGQSVFTEDVIQIGSVDYLVVQNVFRTGDKDYIAVQLG